MKVSEKKGLRGLLLGLMLLAFTATFVARFIWSPLQSTMIEVYGIDTTLAGAVFSVFFTGYIITQVPAGILADKFGVKMLMSVSMLIIGVASWSMIYISDVSTAMALRVLLGLGAGAIYACCARVVTNYFEPEKRSMAFGVVLAGPNAGFFIASYLGPKILLSYGWQTAFQFAGIFAVVVGILILVFVKGDKANAESRQTLKDVLKGFGHLFKNKGVLLISLSGFGLMWFQLALYNWAFGYAKSLGFAASIGTVGVSIAIGGILASILSGVIVDKFKIDRRKFLIISYTLTIIMVFIFGNQKEITALIVSSFMLGLVSYSSNTHLTALVIDYSGKSAAATATGFSNFVYQFASQISPVVIGALLVSTAGVYNNFIWATMAIGPAIGILFLVLAASAKKAEEVI